MVLDGCCLDEPVKLDEAAAQLVRMRDCSPPGLTAVAEGGGIDLGHDALQKNWPFAGSGGGAMQGLRTRRRLELARERYGMSWFEVPGIPGSLADGRSACLTPSCPRPAPAAAPRTRAAGSRVRHDRSLSNRAIRARGSIAAKDMA
jgi:hypothetical protein